MKLLLGTGMKTSSIDRAKAKPAASPKLHVSQIFTVVILDLELALLYFQLQLSASRCYAASSLTWPPSDLKLQKN